MNPHLTRRHALLTAAALACPARSAWAQDAATRFPTRAVRLVVPYSVGIGPDVVARSVAEQLARQWQQTVWVDNKPGASGIVAFGDVRRTAPDGHTLYLADTATLSVNPLLQASLPYDPQRDLAPLTLLFRATFLLWTGGSSRWRTLVDLQDAARREPGRLSYGTLGNGHASHVAVESYAHAAGLRFLHVPFKDAGTLFTAVASGDVDFTTFGMNSVAGLYQSGRMRPLAVAARRRLGSHPDIPTLPEAGGPPVEMHPWAAIVAVAGTPPALLQQIHRDLTTAMARPEVLTRTAQAGFEITPSSPQALLERIEADLALVRPLLADGRINAQL
jgi:tripartite-type tricarboxylate transporter receptor subunit TctC